MKIVILILIFIILILILFAPLNTNPSYNNFNGIKNSLIKKSHILNIIPLNTLVCKENLLLFNSIMNQFDIFYWISEGTALGAIRENRILPWDDDVDVSFNFEYRDKFINEALPILLKNGFIIGEVRQNNNFIVLLRKNEKLDIDIVQKDGECTANRTKNTNYNIDCNNLIKYLNNIHQITFLGTQFNVPGEDYLEYLYGKDWKIPIKK